MGSNAAGPLEEKILAAHASDDRQALVLLYSRAADQTTDEDTQAFFLTYAYVFALEIGHPLQSELFLQLQAMGRE